MRRDQWLAEFAEKLGVDAPTKDEVVALLDIAATAAHSSERTAAPIACWLAGRTDVSPGELKALAEAVAPEGERQADDQGA
jgi:Domain of unknown function (DUF6457)